MTNTQHFAFKKAERTSVKLKIGVQGPSGSGKTMGALALARTFAPDGKIAVIDTENESASFYADEYDFETLSLGAPYTSARYVEAIKAAADAGFDVLVIDSISHQWAGTGGILERKDLVDQRGGNSYTNWGPFTKEHELFKARILEAPIHIIATLRTKQDYALEDNEKGKKQPKKLGMAPIQREGFEYEFGVVFELQMDHRAKISKDRTGLFEDSQLIDLRDAKIGKTLRQWLRSGKPTMNGAPPAEAAPTSSVATAAPAKTATKAESSAELTLDEAKAMPLPGKPGSWGGKAGEPLGDFSNGHLKSIRDWMIAQIADHENELFERAIAAIRLILEDRQKDQMKLQLESTPAELNGEDGAAPGPGILAIRRPKEVPGEEDQAERETELVPATSNGDQAESADREFPLSGGGRR